jgi:hypothetical protein
MTPLVRRTSRAIGDYARSQPKQAGWKYLLQTCLTAFVIVFVISGTMLIVGLVLRWAANGK